MTAVPLQCGVQQYEWGKLGANSRVAKAVGRDSTHPTEKFAELWAGTHPSLPSLVLSPDNTKTPLSDYLAAHGKDYFSDVHQAGPFKGQVPFLLKILSIGKALSIQAHPDKALAEELHARDPKNYKDPNHKPELIVALTPFQGLCCFRGADVVRSNIERIAPLRGLLGETVSNNESETDDVTLRSVMKALYTAPKDKLVASLQQHQKDLTGTAAELHSAEDKVFLRLCGDYPGDVGCWMVYILNLVSLQPGEGLFLSANEPHAYLEGDGVEVMATSDNVVRAGLTPKFMDVDTLLSMLTYSTSSFTEAYRKREDGAAVQWYRPPSRYQDFSLYRVTTAEAGAGAVSLTLPTVGLGLVMEGEGTVNGLAVTEGSSFLCTPSVTVQTTKPLSIFIASTNGKE